VGEEDEKAREEKVDELESIAKGRWRVAVVLTGAMLVTYFGFILLVAYRKAALGALVAPGLSWGILLGALVIVVAWVLTGIYVRWANRTYDAALAKIRGKK
jgi:uncharacterized membrane protein (DUF485 family)